MDDVPARDRRDIMHIMQDELLEVSTYPTITYACPADGATVRGAGGGGPEVQLRGRLTLHGVTRSQPVTARVMPLGDSLRASGEIALRQPDYSLKPLSVAGSMLKQGRGEARLRHRRPEIGAAMCLAIPGQVVELMEELRPIAVVDVTGVRRKVDLGLLADDMPAVGDWVLIHVGFAMSRISEVEAAEQMRILRMLGEDAAAMEEVRGYGLEPGA